MEVTFVTNIDFFISTVMINSYKNNNNVSWKVCVYYKFVGYVTVPFLLCIAVFMII